MSVAAKAKSENCIGAVRLAIARTLRQAGVDSPELDARLLLGHALGLDHGALNTMAARPLAPAELHAAMALGARRIAGEPVARIVERKEFWGLELRIGAATLVPRPETETIVEAALASIDQEGRRADSLRLADIGTGSGAILLALLSELPRAKGVGTDIAVSTLATARQNASRLGFASRASFVACNFVAALTGPFDLIVANPPYIRSSDIAELPVEVRDYDPRAALDGGPDGLAAYRAIASDMRRVLLPDGVAVLELGAGQEPAVAELLSQAGAKLITARPDLAGIARALIARF